MRAAVYETAGSSEGLQVREVPTPDPGPGEVRVRIALSGIKPSDWKRRTNAEPQVGPFQIPNQDGAGTIESVGSGVDPSRVGERVWLYMAARDRPWGTAAEYTVIPAE